MRSIKRRALEATLEKQGCELLRSTGGHDVWECGTCQAPVPRHSEVAAGTLRSIEKLLEPCLGRGWLTR